MSTYTEVTTEFRSIEDLQAALDKCGLEYEVYPAQDGIYRKWSLSSHENLCGRMRGGDAALVIHGGLDTTPRRYCGDTAFVWEGDVLRAKRDVTHGNAKENWTAIKNNYALASLERQAERHGLRLEQVKTAGGRITLRAYPAKQGTARRRMVVRKRGAIR